MIIIKTKNSSVFNPDKFINEFLEPLIKSKKYDKAGYAILLDNGIDYDRNFNNAGNAFLNALLKKIKSNPDNEFMIHLDYGTTPNLKGPVILDSSYKTTSYKIASDNNYMCFQKDNESNLNEHELINIFSKDVHIPAIFSKLKRLSLKYENIIEFWDFIISDGDKSKFAFLTKSQLITVGEFYYNKGFGIRTSYPVHKYDIDLQNNLSESNTD